VIASFGGLAAYDAELKAVNELWPTIRFHALREHAGLVFQSNPVA
jgi:peptide chain release factor 3